MRRPFYILVLFLCFVACAVSAQAAPVVSKSPDAELKFVVYVSRHGVRSPTGRAEQYNPYSTAAWPAWDVAPGYLTAHGYHLMELFGAYDRMELAGQGLLSASGCEDAAHVTIHADSDQRTRETGKATRRGNVSGMYAAGAGSAGRHGRSAVSLPSCRSRPAGPGDGYGGARRANWRRRQQPDGGVPLAACGAGSDSCHLRRPGFAPGKANFSVRRSGEAGSGQRRQAGGVARTAEYGVFPDRKPSAGIRAGHGCIERGLGLRGRREAALADGSAHGGLGL